MFANMLCLIYCLWIVMMAHKSRRSREHTSLTILIQFHLYSCFYQAWHQPSNSTFFPWSNISIERAYFFSTTLFDRWWSGLVIEIETINVRDERKVIVQRWWWWYAWQRCRSLFDFIWSRQVTIKSKKWNRLNFFIVQREKTWNPLVSFLMIELIM